MYISELGGGNQVKVEIHLLQQAYKHPVAFDFYHLISGVDYPLQTNAAFDTFFEQNRDKAFIDKDGKPWDERYELYHFNDWIDMRAPMSYITRKLLNRVMRWQRNAWHKGIRLRPKIKMQIYKGSQWWSLNHATVEYIRTFLAQNRWYKRRFRFTDCCDEIFFQIMLYNATDERIRANLANQNLRYIDWKDRGEPLPNILVESDFEPIRASNAFFCRKIDSIRSAALLDKIDAHL